MPIILKQTLSSGSQADGKDTRQIKDALNRLGYYTPYETAGITQYPDAQLFAAIKKFQKDNNLPVTGTIKPDDATLSELNTAVESAPNGYYIWRSVKDTKARPKHAALDGTMRKWGETPYPGSEPNCRCWAEAITVPEDVKDAFNNVKRKLNEFENKKYALSSRLLRHYLGGTGKTVILQPNTFDKSDIVTKAISTNRERFVNELAGGLNNDEKSKFRQLYKTLKYNKPIIINDYWDVDVVDPVLTATPDRDFANSIGSGKIQSKGVFIVIRKNNEISITGDVIHSIHDMYDFNNDRFIDKIAFRNERELAKKRFAKPFNVIWEKHEKVTGTGIIENGKVKNIVIEWNKVK